MLKSPTEFSPLNNPVDVVHWWCLDCGPSPWRPSLTLQWQVICMNIHEVLYSYGTSAGVASCSRFSWVSLQGSPFHPRERITDFSFLAPGEIMAGAPGIKGLFLVVFLQLALLCSSQVSPIVLLCVDFFVWLKVTDMLSLCWWQNSKSCIKYCCIFFALFSH